MKPTKRAAAVRLIRPLVRVASNVIVPEPEPSTDPGKDKPPKDKDKKPKKEK